MRRRREPQVRRASRRFQHDAPDLDAAGGGRDLGGGGPHAHAQVVRLEPEGLRDVGLRFRGVAPAPPEHDVAGLDRGEEALGLGRVGPLREVHAVPHAAGHLDRVARAALRGVDDGRGDGRGEPDDGHELGAVQRRAVRLDPELAAEKF